MQKIMTTKQQDFNMIFIRKSPFGHTLWCGYHTYTHSCDQFKC